MERSDLNKMTAGNLAVVFGPNLCRPPLDGSLQITLASHAECQCLRGDSAYKPALRYGQVKGFY